MRARTGASLCGGGQKKVDGPRTAHDYRPWRVDGPGGGIPADPRNQDAGVARVAAVRKRASRCRVSGETSQGCEGPLSRAEVASRPRAGETPDEGIWFDAGV